SLMKKSTKFCVISVVMMFVNVIILFIMEYFIGGNATNGDMEADMCYVMDSEGVMTEVSKPVFIFSYAFTCITVLSIAVGIPSAIALQFKSANSPFLKVNKE
ncbi:MAG: hypothetical protein IJR93_06165, partial [Treponema sp.]|nr:hypothetical protein [Treponema sp.]